MGGWFFGAFSFGHGFNGLGGILEMVLGVVSKVMMEVWWFLWESFWRIVLGSSGGDEGLV